MQPRRVDLSLVVGGTEKMLRRLIGEDVDVKFVLEDENGGKTEKTIALPHADLIKVSHDTGRKMDDPWCSRIAELHLLHLVETGEDMEKNLVTLTLPDLKRYAAQLP